MFVFLVLGLVSSVLLAKRLAGKSVSQTTYFVWSVMQNLNSTPSKGIIYDKRISLAGER